MALISSPDFRKAQFGVRLSENGAAIAIWRPKVAARWRTRFPENCCLSLKKITNGWHWILVHESKGRKPRIGQGVWQPPAEEVNEMSTRPPERPLINSYGICEHLRHMSGPSICSKCAVKLWMHAKELERRAEALADAYSMPPCPHIWRDCKSAPREAAMSEQPRMTDAQHEALESKDNPTVLEFYAKYEIRALRAELTRVQAELVASKAEHDKLLSWAGELGEDSLMVQAPDGFPTMTEAIRASIDQQLRVVRAERDAALAALKRVHEHRAKLEQSLASTDAARQAANQRADDAVAAADKKYTRLMDKLRRCD